LDDVSARCDDAMQLAVCGFRVVRFEFPYIASNRKTGKRRPPDREPVLRETWLRVVELLGRKGLVIGGKSMGGSSVDRGKQRSTIFPSDLGTRSNSQPA